MRGAVLVTGGVRRIGAAICGVLASGGWKTLAHARAGVGDLAGDLLREGAEEEIMAKAFALEPGLCALVNNASAFSTARELPEEESAKLMRVNAEAPVRLARLFAERLKAEGREGCVVNLLDARVARGDGGTPYGRSKRRLWEATAELAAELAPNVRVNGVAPGPVLAPEAPENSEKGGEVLLGRRPGPADVAGAVAYFLGAGGVTGQILCVDSGQSVMRGSF